MPSIQADLKHHLISIISSLHKSSTITHQKTEHRNGIKPNYWSSKRKIPAYSLRTFKYQFLLYRYKRAQLPILQQFLYL